jgi:hypothetical protein
MIMTDEGDGNYFGVCPICGHVDGSLGIGHVTWFYCKAHKLRWWDSIDFIIEMPSGAIEEGDTDLEEQERRYDELDFGTFTAIKPVFAAGEPLFIDEAFYKHTGQKPPRMRPR